MSAQEDAVVEAVVDALMRTERFTVYETARTAILAYQKATADADMAWAVDAAKKIDPAAKSRPWLEWRLELARDEVIEMCAKMAESTFFLSDGVRDWKAGDKIAARIRALKSPAGENK